MSYAIINGFTCYYEHSNPYPNAPTVLFLNGIMSPTYSWNEQARLVESLGFNVVLMEHRCQWRSGYSEGHLDFRVHAHDVAALIDYLGIDSVHVVGISYGGEVAAMFAACYKERTDSLMIMSSCGYTDTHVKNVVLGWRQLMIQNDPAALFNAVVTDVYSDETIANNQEFVKKRAAALIEATKKTPLFFDGQLKMLQVYLDQYKNSKEGILPFLQPIDAPTLIISGGQDKIKPPGKGVELANAIRGSSFVVLPTAGHSVYFEAKETVNALLSGHLLNANFYSGEARKVA